MKWPFARKRSEATAIQMLATSYNDLLVTERKRYDELLTKYHQLKLQGYSAPEPPAPVPPPPKVDEIARAINQKAGTDRQLRALMWRDANTQKAAGMADDEIVARIHRGISLEEYIGAGDMTT